MYIYVYSIYIYTFMDKYLDQNIDTVRGGGLGSRPKKMYGERLGDGFEYHLMSPHNIDTVGENSRQS